MNDQLEDRYRAESGTIYLSGLQALVRLPLDLMRRDRVTGLRTRAFIAGYEGSPLAGYDLELGRQNQMLEAAGVLVRPAVNEELAANAVQGTQLAATLPGFEVDGVIGIWYGKAPGLDRASDALRHANLGGAHPKGGALVVVGDDSTAKSSTVPSSSELAMAELGMPVLSPADPQDVLDLGMHAVELSRASGLWVGMKIATNVADGSATAEVHPPSTSHRATQSSRDDGSYQHEVSATFVHPTVARLEESLYTGRLERVRDYAAVHEINRVYGDRSESARVGVIVAGCSYLDVRQALTNLGIGDSMMVNSGIRLLRLGLVHPLVPDEIRRFADGLDEIIVVEEKRPFIEGAVKEILYLKSGAPVISGKCEPGGRVLLRSEADLSPERIASALAMRLSIHMDLPERPRRGSRPPLRIALPVLPRTPFFCSGCPHNRSTEVPEGSVVGAGMGCSGMVTTMHAERVGEVIGLTQMGGEGAVWIGAAPFVSGDHLIQNMGDGTYHHSGSLSIRAAVASGENITFKLLYNSAVAMTGGQDVIGVMGVPDLVRELQSEGVARVAITTEEPRRYRRRRLRGGARVYHRDKMVAVQEELAKVAGVTVLIHDQECATELRRKRKRKLASDPTTRIYINERVCEGCGDCGTKSNCLSVQPVATEYGRKTQIHQASCNKDYSCLAGDCPSFLTVTPGAPVSSSTARRETVPDLDAGTLPDPDPLAASDDVAVRLTGIGGTGVVTVAQIVAIAGVRAGRHVRTLDQTGLAQKGGAVVSDVRISRERLELANKIGEGQADLYLGCDVLVAADIAHLKVASPDRTVAVVSTAEVPTGTMVADPTVAFPSADQTTEGIIESTRRDVSRFVDARSWTLKLFDDDQYANIFLLGAAFQAGTLPLPVTTIEEAIELNGVAVRQNVQAFRRGRQFVHDVEALESALAAPVTTPSPSSPRADRIAGLVRSAPESELSRIVLDRVQELIAYQGQAYARQYASRVEAMREVEARTCPGSERLAESVARYLYKLMAYKDEYEVARLSLAPELDAELRAQFGSAYRARYRLHPPVLRALGMSRKVSLGPWFRPFFAVLRMARRLRGTPLDPFGYAKIRRVERELLRDYLEVLHRLAAGLSEENHADAVAIAELPDAVRGYEEIKLGNVDRYRVRLAELLDGYDPAPAGHLRVTAN